MAETEKLMAELLLGLVEDLLSKGSDESTSGPSEPKRSRLDYKMEKRDFSQVPHIPGMDWANCSWLNPWDLTPTNNASPDI